MPTERVELDGGRLLCIERFGAPGGTPVLYFHGLPGSRLDLLVGEAVFTETGVAVIAVDRPGFGGSPFVRGRALLDWPRDIEALADRLGLERFAALGYSSGGKYAIACAAALPERLSLAGVMAGCGPPETPGFRQSFAGIERISLTLSTRVRPLALGLWGALRRMALNHPSRLMAQLEKESSAADRAALADPDTRAAVVRSVQEGLRPGVAGSVDDHAIEARPWGFALEEIRLPAQLWHGDSDEVVPLEHSRYMAKRIPGAQLTVVQGAGHLLSSRLEPIAHTLVSAASS